ncbi:MAG: hypothetical protein ACYC6G_02485 [Desulfobaccales bacterium]
MKQRKIFYLFLMILLVSASYPPLAQGSTVTSWMRADVGSDYLIFADYCSVRVKFDGLADNKNFDEVHTSASGVYSQEATLGIGWNATAFTYIFVPSPPADDSLEINLAPYNEIHIYSRLQQQGPGYVDNVTWSIKYSTDGEEWHNAGSITPGPEYFEGALGDFSLDEVYDGSLIIPITWVDCGEQGYSAAGNTSLGVMLCVTQTVHVASAPLPPALLLVGSGLLGLAGLRKFRQR